jgi:antitoxin (DNA-binding transcriptional repressor) of toxin-antitoxin stability system
MRTIGVRDLKARLSQVLRELQGGEPVLVTDRGRVVAELRLPEPTTGGRPAASRGLARLAGAGHLRVAERAAEPYQTSPLVSPEGLSRQLLAEERAEP